MASTISAPMRVAAARANPRIRPERRRDDERGPPVSVSSDQVVRVLFAVFVLSCTVEAVRAWWTSAPLEPTSWQVRRTRSRCRGSAD